MLVALCAEGSEREKRLQRAPHLPEESPCSPHAPYSATHTHTCAANLYVSDSLRTLPPRASDSHAISPASWCGRNKLVVEAVVGPGQGPGGAGRGLAAARGLFVHGA